MTSLKLLLYTVIASSFVVANLRAAENFASPNKAFLVKQVEQKGNQKQSIQVVTTDSEKVLVSLKSQVRSIEVVWNPSSSVVAINNYTGNSGDAVYVIGVHGHVGHILRRPDSGAFVNLLQVHYPKLHDLERFTLAAERWDDNKLVMSCEGEARDTNNNAKSFKCEVRFDSSTGQKDKLVFGPLQASD